MKKQKIRRVLAFVFLIGTIIGTNIFFSNAVFASTATKTIDKYFEVKGTTLIKYTGTEKNIVVPDGITSIGSNAFANVKKTMKTVTLPDSVVEIQDFAFCNSTLEKITFSKNVKKIGLRAFDGSKQLKEISTLDGIEEIADLAFDDTPWWEEQKKEHPIVIFNGILFYGQNYEGDLEIPNTVTKINAKAFEGNKNLTSVTIPDSVKTIENQAFSGCSNLENVTLPHGLKIIEAGTFESCSSLKEITIPDSVTQIQSNSFWDCGSLTRIDIPSSVKLVDLNLTDCPWLEEQRKENPLVIVNGNVIDGTTCTGKVKIPNGVTRIAQHAFAFNKEITSVTIPSSVTKIGRGAFNSCTGIKTMIVPDSVTNIGSFVWEGCTKLESIQLSTRLKTIPEYTFADCLSLKQITIPSSVTKLDVNWLSNCPKLKDIVVSSNIKNAILFASSYPKDVVIHAPKGSYMERIAKKVKITCKPIAMNKTKATLKTKKTLQLNVGTNTTLTTWKSSKPSVASVSSSGKVTAKKKGTAVITGTLYDKKYTCKITVV